MSSEQFSLKWNNHTEHIVGVFESLLQSESLVDVTLACEGRSLRAHKLVLSACSPYFKTLFQEHSEAHPVVILRDVKFAELRSIVQFMYKGEVEVDQHDINSLISTAESLQIRGLAGPRAAMSSHFRPSSESLDPPMRPDRDSIDGGGASGDRKRPSSALEPATEAGEPPPPSLPPDNPASASSNGDDHAAVKRPKLEMESGEDNSIDGLDSGGAWSGTTFLCPECGLSFHRQHRLHQHHATAHAPTATENCLSAHAQSAVPPDGAGAPLSAGLPHADSVGSLSSLARRQGSITERERGRESVVRSPGIRPGSVRIRSPGEVVAAVEKQHGGLLGPLVGGGASGDSAMAAPFPTTQSHSWPPHDLSPQTLRGSGSLSADSAFRELPRDLSIPRDRVPWERPDRLPVPIRLPPLPHPYILPPLGSNGRGIFADIGRVGEIFRQRFQPVVTTTTPRIPDYESMAPINLSSSCLNPGAQRASPTAASPSDGPSAPSTPTPTDENKAVTCKYCTRVFESIPALMDHMPVHQGDRPFVCEWCRKAFKFRHHLKDHERIHTGERPFECRICGKTFARSSILKTHTKIHKQEGRRFELPPGSVFAPPGVSGIHDIAGLPEVSSLPELPMPPSTDEGSPGT